ncbi:MAG: DUF11 domain-containing protein [Pirellulales bacterium]
MAPRNSSTQRSKVWQWLEGLVRGRRSDRSRSSMRRRLRIEPLETRALLANDLATISGRVFKDVTGNGFTAGEQIAGATLNLFVDDGDGVFEPGTQDLAPVLPIPSTATSNAQGLYSFGNITAASYWVQQPAQTVGAVSLAETHFLVVATAADVDGTLGRPIDNFLSPGPSITATQGVPDAAVQSSLPPAETIGGERDLQAQMTSGGVTDNVKFNAAGNLLNLDPTVNANGLYIATWDGPDANPTSLNATGLGGVDLTEGGINSGILMRVQVDKANSVIKFRVFTNAGNVSEQTISNIAPNILQDVYFPFTGFAPSVGTGANFASVGAVQLEVQSNVTGMDGLVSLVGLVGPTLLVQNFANYTPADLAVTKQVNNPTPNVGQQIQYTVTLTNNGPSQATNVVVTDNLPAGVSFVSATPSQGTYNSQTGLWSVGTVNVQASATLTIVATVTQSGVRINTATVTSADQNDENPANNSGTAQIATPQVDLAVQKSVNDSTPDKNQNVTFTVTVQNNGPDTATGVTIEDILPSGLTFVSATPSVGTFSNGTGIWNVGTLNNQASATLSIVATVTGLGTNNTITNTASVKTVDQGDTNPANNQDSEVLTPNRVDIAVLKTVNDNTPDKNQNVTFTVTATNNGPAAATGVTLTDLLPAGLTFVSATPSGSTTFNSATGLWTIGALGNTAGNNSATLTIVATVVASNTITNTASLSAVNQFDTNSQNDSDSETLTPNQLDLAVLKTVDDNTPDKNQNVTFTVTVTNNGPTAASGVQITDQIPSGLTFVSATPSVGTYSSATGLWTLGALSNTAGQNTATLQIVATVTGTTAITNTASLTAIDQFDTNTANNQDSETVTPNVLDLAVAKTVDDNTPDKNQNVTFTVTVTNNGPSTATGVQITDQLPSGLTFVSATPSVGSYSSATGVWTLGALNSTAGQNTATLQLVATVTAASTITNTATLSAVNQTDTNTANNQASAVVTPNQADLAITKTVSPTTAGVNQETVFTLTIQNNGPANATNVQVTDVLPAGLTFVGVDSATSGTYNNTTGIWTVGSLSATAGQNTATLKIRARSTGTVNAVTNTATITQSSQFDPVTNNNTSSTTVTTRILSKRSYLADTAVQ